MILKFIRFNDPEADEPNNKMSCIHKNSGLLDNICKQWHPEQDLSIDETLLIFKGRLFCKQLNDFLPGLTLFIFLVLGAYFSDFFGI